jgi:hypothetical protein
MNESRFWRGEKEGEEGKSGEAEVNAWTLRLRTLIATCTLRHVNEKKQLGICLKSLRYLE